MGGSRAWRSSLPPLRTPWKLPIIPRPCMWLLQGGRRQEGRHHAPRAASVRVRLQRAVGTSSSHTEKSGGVVFLVGRSMNSIHSPRSPFWGPFRISGEGDWGLIEAVRAAEGGLWGELGPGEPLGKAQVKPTSCPRVGVLDGAVSPNSCADGVGGRPLGVTEVTGHSVGLPSPRGQPPLDRAQRAGHRLGGMAVAWGGPCPTGTSFQPPDPG